MATEFRLVSVSLREDGKTILWIATGKSPALRRIALDETQTIKLARDLLDCMALMRGGR